jgi:hypothetical protein
MRRLIRMLLGALTVFTIVGGLSALPIAKRSLAHLSAQQMPASLDAFQAVPKQYRSEILAAMTPDAIASILRQRWDVLLADPETSPELKALLPRMKALATGPHILRGRELMDRYHQERDKFARGERADEPHPREGYTPEMWSLLMDLYKLPPTELSKTHPMNFPETTTGKDKSAASFWMGATEWLKTHLGPVQLIASAASCRCVVVDIGPMPCNDQNCFDWGVGPDHYCDRSCDPYLHLICAGGGECNGGCKYCYRP